MAGSLCDFCGAKDVGWIYPANNFRRSPASQSMGAWCACNICHNLIQENDRAGLALRSYEQIKEHIKFPPELRMILQSEIRELHDMFFAHQTGLPRRHTNGWLKPAAM